MVALLPVVLFFADAPPAVAENTTKQASSAAPSTTTSSTSVGEAAPTTVPACPQSTSDSQTIVICTERPQGYRLNPDVMEARRETKNSGRPVRPGGSVRPDCVSVGPAPCVTAGVNLVGAALTAAQMAERLAKGQEVGSMFATDPHPSEYQLYLMAKARREAEDAQKAALAKEKAAEAAQQGAAKGATQSQPSDPSHD